MTEGSATADGTLQMLATRCVTRATERGVTLATAESCTGGLVAHLLTDVPGASKVFQGGWVPYDNARKTADLGVDPALMIEHGAVSGPVAKALAAGAREKAGTTLGLATTGIAGPTGGTDEKPVGTVWLAVATATDVHGECFMTDAADRAGRKRAFARRALELLFAAIEAHPEPARP